MNCPRCDSFNTRVAKSESEPFDVIRVRQCSECGCKFYTEERIGKASELNSRLLEIHNFKYGQKRKQVELSEGDAKNFKKVIPEAIYCGNSPRDGSIYKCPICNYSFSSWATAKNPRHCPNCNNELIF